MVRKLLIAAVAAGLLTCVGGWAAAAVIATARPGGNTCYALGYARPDSWLLSAVVYSDGFVFVQWFQENLSRHRGLFVRPSPMSASHAFRLRALVPSWQRGRVATAISFHLGLPLLLLSATLTRMSVVPAGRRRARRRRRQCVACAYDLRGATSSRCSECGHVNSYLGIAAEPAIATGDHGGAP